jgi:RNA recognition motif-containing protein
MDRSRGRYDLPPSEPEENSRRALVEALHPFSLFRFNELDREIHTGDKLGKEKIMNLFVGNFDQRVTERDLAKLFAKYGTVETSIVYINFETGKSRGFGFVRMKDDREAERAIRKLNDKRWHGRRLMVSRAHKR